MRPSVRRVPSFLKELAADYRLVYTGGETGAQRVAAAAHVPGRRVAKVVVVREEGGAALMVVLPATQRLDLRALAWATREGRLSLVTRGELAALFPDCEPGVVPPFGSLYGMPVYADACLRGAPELLLPGGDGRRAVSMSWREFDRLAVPIVAPLCLHPPAGRPA
jgi:Ala-tRNA(Pro) deacylase